MAIFEGFRQLRKWWNRPKPPELWVRGYTFPTSNLLSIYTTLETHREEAHPHRTRFWVEIIKILLPPTHKLGVVVYGREDKPDGVNFSNEIWHTLVSKGYLDDCTDWNLVEFLIGTLPTRRNNYGDPELVSLLGFLVYQGDDVVFQLGVPALIESGVLFSGAEKSLHSIYILCTFGPPEDDPQIFIDTEQIPYSEVCQRIVDVALQRGYVSRIDPLKSYPYPDSYKAEDLERYARKPLRQSDIK